MTFEPVFPKLMPWRQIFDDMKAHGCAYSKQAEMVGAAWSTFGEWMDGKREPRHAQGVALLAMHAAICGSELSAERQRQAVDMDTVRASA